MEISNPQRLLILGPPDAGTLPFLRNLTGSAPDAIDGSTAGLSHVWSINTTYYTATIPIWLDEITDVEEWKTEFSKDEAKEVVTAVGAWMYCFRRPLSEDDVKGLKAALGAIKAVIEKGYGYGFDGVCLAVAMPQSTTPYLEKTGDEWEDVCREFGFEYVDSEATGRNEYSEPVGMARVKEALEANEWEGGFDDGGLDGEDDWEGTLAARESEMDMEAWELNNAISDSRAEKDGREDQVMELERMLSRLKAVKEKTANMPDAEKKRYAANAVDELMKSF